MSSRHYRSPVDRRVVLKRMGLWSVCIAGGGVLAACGPDESNGPAGVEFGLASDVAENSGTYFAEAAAFVCRDANGYYAMTSICTHQQCNMGSQGVGCGIRDDMDLTQGLRCCCHLSEYDGNGAVTMGPAPDDLVHYAVTIDGDGVLYVDPESVVDPTERA